MSMITRLVRYSPWAASSFRLMIGKCAFYVPALLRESHPMHIALLGDSTFDSRTYTEGTHDVITHLLGLLVGSDQATVLARDGAVIADVYGQIERLEALLDPETEPEPVTHAVLSVGGNDLLEKLPVLDSPVESVGEALLAVRERSESFGRAYRDLLDRLLEVEAPSSSGERIPPARLRSALCTGVASRIPRWPA